MALESRYYAHENVKQYVSYEGLDSRQGKLSLRVKACGKDKVQLSQKICAQDTGLRQDTAKLQIYLF